MDHRWRLHPPFSREGRAASRWESLESAFQEQLIISGRVPVAKGGFGGCRHQGFHAGSQVDPRPIRNLETFTGQDIPSRSSSSTAAARRRSFAQAGCRAGSHRTQDRHAGTPGGRHRSHRRGQEPETEYGAFIDLGGIDGLLHVTDMSYGRVAHPSEVVHPGDEITVRF